MSVEGIPPSVKRAQEKAMLELETAIGYRHIFDERGMLKIRTTVFIVGFTALLVLIATYATVSGAPTAWLWWILVGIFVFGLVMMFFSYYMMRRERVEKKGV